MNTNTSIKVALTGGVALEMLASYFRDAGYDVMPQDVPLDEFAPDFVYDVTSHDEVLAAEVAGFRDERMMKLAGCPYSVDGIRAIVDEFGWLVAARGGALPPRTAKILAVDADNTLWKGILTEDGPGALAPCAAFQAGLKRLAEEGVVLVLLSKNDEEAVANYFHATGMSRLLCCETSEDTRHSCGERSEETRHSCGETSEETRHSCRVREECPPLLRLDDFACCKVNWAPKAGNLVEACRELNLGTDSVVFVDDNPHERAQMKAHLPEVTVAPWNGWTPNADGDVSDAAQRQLVRRLREYFFSGAAHTREDRLRAGDYRAQAERRAVAARFASHDDYLDDLGLWVKPSLATADDLDRLAQMAGKTNQFNATTIRRTREEFEALLGSESHRVFVFRAGDRFGEQGIVCYVVVDVPSGRVTDFVMSCRAMGRTLEHFALAHVQKEMGTRLEIDYVPTAKNRPFADFLASVPRGLVTHFKEVR